MKQSVIREAKKTGLESGWLFKSESRTQYYLLEYFEINGTPSSSYSKNKFEIISESGRNITQCECILISRKVVQDMVLNYFELENPEIFEEIPKIAPEGKTSFYTIEDGKVKQLSPSEKKKENIYICCSGKLAERPVNVIIRKKLLTFASDEVFVLKK